MVEPTITKTDKTKIKSAEPGISTSRIRTIMKSTADIAHISQEGLHTMTKATEMFIQYLSRSAHKSGKSNTITYDQLADLVENEDNLEFLLQIIPQKITVKEFKEIIEKSNNQGSDSSSEEDEEIDEKVPNKKPPKK